MLLRRLGLAVLLLTACSDSEGSPVPPWAPLGGVSRVTIDGETLHYAQLLGRSRSDIEPGLAAPNPSRDATWIFYGNDLAVRYADGRAAELRARIPMAIDLDCIAGARWMGFANPRMPLRDGPRCVWPGPRLQHRLDKGYGGELNLQTRWFDVWLTQAA